jgi:hypothetical protein
MFPILVCGLGSILKTVKCIIYFIKCCNIFSYIFNHHLHILDKIYAGLLYARIIFKIMRHEFPSLGKGV